MKTNKMEWKKIEESNWTRELNIKGQLRNIKSKQLIKPHYTSLQGSYRMGKINLGSLVTLRWKYFKGEITSELYLRGWTKINKYNKDISDWLFIKPDGSIYNAKYDNCVETHLSNGYKMLNDIKQYYIHIILASLYKEEYYEGCHIHHIDEDKLNNSLSNLSILSAEEHMSIHAKDRMSNSKRDSNGKFI